MTDAPRAPRGRPRLGSAALLEEAAFELFLENGYAGTTVEQISRRAGVSRNTFFNYFTAKSDVFWVGLDSSIDVVERVLAAAPRTVDQRTAVRTALLEAADTLGPSDVPWVLTHFELIGSSHEVMASAIGRASRLARLLSGDASRDGDDPVARTLAYASVAATVSALQTWARHGPQRGRLEPHLALALDPVLEGFAPAT